MAAGAVGARPRPFPPPPCPQPAMAAPRPVPIVPPREAAPVFDPFADAAPLALSAEQMVASPPAAEAPLDFNDFMADEVEAPNASGPVAEFIDPEDIAFEPEEEPPAPEPEPLPAPARPAPAPPPVAS